MEVPSLIFVVAAAEAAKQVRLSRLVPPVVIQAAWTPRSSARWMFLWTSTIVSPLTAVPTSFSAMVAPRFVFQMDGWSQGNHDCAGVSSSRGANQANQYGRLRNNGSEPVNAAILREDIDLALKVFTEGGNHQTGVNQQSVFDHCSAIDPEAVNLPGAEIAV